MVRSQVRQRGRQKAPITSYLSSNNKSNLTCLRSLKLVVVASVAVVWTPDLAVYHPHAFTVLVAATGQGGPMAWNADL